MQNGLKKYFPMLKSRGEVLKEIYDSERMRKIFEGWEPEAREEFLDFCTGVRGVKVLYDSFAKELLNPEIYPERLNELLSLLIGKEVTIIRVLPNDNTRIGEESSLLVMDIVVRLEDGSLANVEIQKIGYAFPGQRSACYSADLLLRQYKDARRRTAKSIIAYREIKDVYTVVLFEKSPREFHRYADTCIHKFQQCSNTGIELELLQKFVFVALDNYRKSHQNKGIESRLDAWLTFLSSDSPERVAELTERYSDFRAMYEQIYELCENIEKVMDMFSKELRELDRNTVRYMMDEMQSEIDQQKEELRAKENVLKEKEAELKGKDDVLKEKEAALQEALKRIEELEKDRQEIIKKA